MATVASTADAIVTSGAESRESTRGGSCRLRQDGDEFAAGELECFRKGQIGVLRVVADAGSWPSTWR